ncbi:cytochrome c3 family protein [Oryzomonas rubra]|nr:cytochrome c3 family protein [Oryzomonas rubra]
MNKLKLRTCAAALIAGVILMSAGAQAHELSGKHAKEGLKCVDCHKVAKPVSAATPDVCLECHGDYGKVAALTKSLHANPHDSHLGQLACTKCHGIHKPSEIVCLECHSEFEFKIK